jgi:flagellar biosynthesis protein FlhG
MSDQAKTLRGLVERQKAMQTVVDEPLPAGARRAKTIAIAGAKGGVGKTNIALNLAIALSQMDLRVCLLDANLGLGNVELLCGLNGYWNLSHVIVGSRKLSDIVLEGPDGISVIPGASGLCDLADCSDGDRREILHQLATLEQSHDYIIIDTGAGIHRAVRQLVAAADIALVVTTPEPTSIADAYAGIKALMAHDVPVMEVVVNRAESSQQARAIMEGLQNTVRLFLRSSIASAGMIPDGRDVPAAVARRRPFLIDSPHCPASVAIRQLARRMTNLAQSQPSRGSFFPRVSEPLRNNKATVNKAA